jgi:anti-anti-sigma factor
MPALTKNPAPAEETRTRRDRARFSLGRTEAREGFAPPPLLITEHRLRGCAVMSARGEIDIATVEQLDLAGVRLLADAGGRLVLDLCDTTFMDLSGVRAAERLSRLARDRGGSLVLVAATPCVLRILGVAAHSWLAITADLDTALEAVAARVDEFDDAL